MSVRPRSSLHGEKAPSRCPTGRGPPRGSVVARRAQLTAASLLLALAGGCHASAGPVFGYALGRGGTVGWEAGGGHDLLLRGSVGQSFRAEEELELMPPPPEQADWPMAADGTGATDEFVPPPPEELLDAPGGLEAVRPRPSEEDEEEEEEDEDEEGAPAEAKAGPVGAERRREVATYLAFEPGFFGGGTIGIGVASADWKPALMLGLWGGVPAPIAAVSDDGASSGSMAWVTLAVGYRYLAGAHEFYVTPKVGFARLPTL